MGGHKIRGVPFLVTDENRAEWDTGPGVRARGMIVDRFGNFHPGAERPVARDSYLALRSLALAVRTAASSAREVLSDPVIARTVRNRPRIKAMLGGVL